MASGIIQKSGGETGRVSLPFQSTGRGAFMSERSQSRKMTCRKKRGLEWRKRTIKVG